MAEERPRVQNPERKHEHESHKRPQQPSKSPEDLKAVLARLSKGGEDKSTKSAPEVSPLRSALADVLKQVDTGVHTAGEPVPPPHKPEEVTPAPVHQKPEETKPVANREEIERLAAEAEAAFSALETHTAPEAKQDTASDDPLAPKKIEKLFKSSGGERSPFAS